MGGTWRLNCGLIHKYGWRNKACLYSELRRGEKVASTTAGTRERKHCSTLDHGRKYYPWAKVGLILGGSLSMAPRSGIGSNTDGSGSIVKPLTIERRKYYIWAKVDLIPKGNIWHNMLTRQTLYEVSWLGLDSFRHDPENDPTRWHKIHLSRLVSNLWSWNLTPPTHLIIVSTH